MGFRPLAPPITVDEATLRIRGDDDLYGLTFVHQAPAGPIVQPDPAG
jgi:hypothetical protein